MRVSLIIPPSGFLLDERVFPTLGVLKVAACLEAGGVEVDVLDLSGVSDVAPAVAQHLATHDTDAYGITATMPQIPVAAEIAQQIRSRTDATIILGGPHVTLMNASAKQERKRGEHSRACQAVAELHDRFDVLVCGDGERAIWIALRDDARGMLIDADEPASDLFLKSTDLEEEPFAARHLIDMGSYHYAIDGVRAHVVIGQLGCPFACNFCGGRRSPFLRRIRTRSADRIVAEMRHLYDTHGTRGFMFFDDELNVNKLFMELLAKIEGLQSDLGVEFRLRGFLKAELITQEMAHAMYRAGFRQVLVGFESGSPRILQNIQKKATRDDNTRAVEMIKVAGLQVKAAMSIGHPGETDETIADSRKWLLSVRPDDFDVSVITVYPGTPYYDDARESSPGVWTYVDPRNGDRLHAKHVDQFADLNYYKGVRGHYQSFVHTDALSSADICRHRDALEDSVRSALRIPYPTAAPAIQYDHSMGQR